MKLPLLGNLAVLTAAACTWPLLAQTVATPAPNAAASSPAAPVPESTVVLSPFEVSGSKDVGYQATETLAGTRIRTNMTDVGDAIQVATKEFMRDINATDSTTLLQYMTNTEVGGTFGNYGGLGDGSVLNDASQRLSPSNTTRVRGLDTADNTRDFYLTDIPWDSYNTSRIDIQRGANSILFGNGSGAGIINGTTDGATIGENDTVLTARAGSYGSYRASLNANISVGDQFAIRVSGLDDHEFYRENPSFDTNERKYVAARWEMKFLEKYGIQSSVRANYEQGDDHANRPHTTPPVDEITPWFLTSSHVMVTPNGTTLGTINPMVSHAGYNPFLIDVNTASLISANPNERDIGAHTTGNANTEPWLWPGTGNGVNGDWYSGLAAIYPSSGTGQMSYYMNGGLNGVTGIPTNGLRAPDMINIVNFANYASASNFLYQGSGVYRSRTITDPSVFNFYDTMIDGPNAAEWSRFHAANAAWDVTAWHERLGFEVAVDHQNYLAGQASTLGGSPVLALDIWNVLPIAVPNAAGDLVPVANPNFGRPFTEGTPSGSQFQNVRNTVRFTPYLRLDAAELSKSDALWTKIVGRHSISGLFETNRTDAGTLGWTGDSMTDAEAQALFGTSAVNITGTTRKLVTLSYLGPSVIGGSLAGANIPGITALQIPTSGPAYYFNPTYLTSAPAGSSPWAQGGVTGLLPNQVGASAANQIQSNNPANYTGWTSTTPVTVWNTNTGDINSLYTGVTQQRTVTTTSAVVDQWSFLNNLVVATVGLRKDGVKTYLAGGNGSLGLNPDGSVNLGTPFGYPSSPNYQFNSDLEKTYDIVLHSPEFINRYLPFGTKISLFYNQSDNFRPESHVGIYGQPLPPPTGTTRDRGVMVSALNDRVSFKLNWYVSQVHGADLPDPGNGLRARLGDEVRRAIEFAYGVQTHNSVDGYHYSDSADPTDTAVYAYQPATGTSATWTKADWVNAEAQAQADAAAVIKDVQTDASTQAFMKAWQIDPTTYSASNTLINYTIPTGLQITADTESKGTEFEMIVRPTDNWNISIDAARTFATRTNLAGTVSDWIVNRWNLYQTTGMGTLRWFGGSQGNASTSTGLARLGRNAWAFYNQFNALEGSMVPELRPYTFNLINNYSFSNNVLKGVFVGGAWRWQDSSTIGYDVTQVTPAISASNPAIGTFNPGQAYHGPVDQHVDLWTGYDRRFKYVDWRIQLNVRNVLDHIGLVPVNTNPDGSVASWRIQDGPSWQLTNTFTF